MKALTENRPRVAAAILFLALPAVGQAQFSYATNNGTITVTGYTGPAGAVTIPANIAGLPVTRIGDFAFQNTSSVTSVSIPNSVTTIGGGAFSGCISLTSVTIPNSVVSIGGDAFLGCTSLTTITIPDSVTSIEPYAFIGCTNLTNVTIGNSVTIIDYGAFEGCTALTTITIPDSVSTIGGWAFENCTGLTSVTIGNSVVSIGEEAFQRCTSLTTITIPNSVTTIRDWAFNDCLSLTSVYFTGNAPSLGGPSVFNNANNATVYYLPGTAGWAATCGGRPTALWVLPNPLILSFGSSFGVQSNGFGFIISWATNIPVVVEASTTLVNPNWFPVGTNTLNSGSSYFSDWQGTDHPIRFYRVRSP